jgi:hypothetical protein
VGKTKTNYRPSEAVTTLGRFIRVKWKEAFLTFLFLLIPSLLQSTYRVPEKENGEGKKPNTLRRARSVKNLFEFPL